MDEMMASIKLFAGSYAPRGWALCNGQLLNVNDYQALFSLLGDTYGGNGRTTFGLPDLRGRTPIGEGQSPGLSSRRRGQLGGFERSTLSIDQMPEHTHDVSCDVDSAGRQLSNTPAGNLCATDAEGTIYGPAANSTMAPSMIQNAGKGSAHENMQPWACINYIICLDGYYPSRI